MSRAILAVLGLGALVLGAFSIPATAGEYYGGGYNGYRTGGNVWYSSSCCYRKVVRHERRVRYVRTYGDGYNGGGYYNGGGAYRSTYYSPPRRYYGDRVVYSSGYRGGYVNSYNDGYGGGERCYARGVRVGDGYGGWVWSRTRVCD